MTTTIDKLTIVKSSRPQYLHMMTAWVPGATSTEAPPYPWGTIPDSDPEDDENATEEGGPNPDPQELEPVPGYETVVFNSGPPVPPLAYEPPAESSCPQQVFDSNDGIGEEAVRAAILAFVDKHCCYGSRPAKNMNITRTIPTHAFHVSSICSMEHKLPSSRFVGPTMWNLHVLKASSLNAFTPIDVQLPGFIFMENIKLSRYKLYTLIDCITMKITSNWCTTN